MPCTHFSGLQPAVQNQSTASLSNANSANSAPAATSPAQTPVVLVLQLFLAVISSIANDRGNGDAGGSGIGVTAGSEPGSNCGCPAGGAQNQEAQADFAQTIEALSQSLNAFARAA